MARVRPVIGAMAAFALTRLMGNLLYKVSPRDPIAYGFALLVLFGVALLACLLPPVVPPASIRSAPYGLD